ncbi:hypothetical protein V2J52_02175 [Georgenia sp. MJ173]|uniref:hypothetical protein n=1 Tax=Georgenia sunbinii TaxID=3117728 RepID=UPI002F26231B
MARGDLAARWAGVPTDVRRIVAGTVLVFGYGTVVHLVQLVRAPAEPYPGAPGWLVAFFVSLTVLDPLVVVLLVRRRRVGHTLACAVLGGDALANGYASYVLDPASGVTAGRVGQGVITGVAVILLATGSRVRPWLRTGGTDR